MLNTAKLSLTTSTNWFGPTAPFGSGGALLTEKVPCGPEKPAPTPSKLFASDGAAAGPGLLWTTGSGVALSGGTGYLWSLCSFFVSSDGAAAAPMLRNGGDVS